MHKLANHGVDLQVIQSKIFEIRGQRVMLDQDLVELYGTEIKTFEGGSEAEYPAFPRRFYVCAEKEEWDILRTKIASSSWGGSRYLLYKA